MKAAQLDRYSREGRLTVREVAVPEPAADEVLIKVRAAAVNPLELLIVRGSIRLIQDYRLPQTLGNECSGVVERVGSRVGKFRPGDAVYTRLPLERIGAFAEYVAVREQVVAKMPAGYAFDVAAAIPLTGLTAWQGLVEELQVQSGQRLLIPGGSGSFGRFKAISVLQASEGIMELGELSLDSGHFMPDEEGDVDVTTRPGRMQNLYLSWRFAWDERMRMNTFIVVFASLTDGRHLFQYLPLMLPLFWIDDTKDEFYWPRSAGIPEEVLLDRSPFETAVE